MYLLDTCTFLWLTMDQARLSAAARQAISDEADRLHVSSVTGFELSQKVMRGKLHLPISTGEWINLALSRHGVKALILDMASATAAGHLPALHADPFDRLLIASAQAHHMTLLTPDNLVRQYPSLRTLW